MFDLFEKGSRFLSDFLKKKKKKEAEAEKEAG